MITTINEFKQYLENREPNGDWFCPHCDSYIDSQNVTFEETHDNCGNSVEYITERSEFDMVSNIGKVKKPVTIELDLKHSMHSMERQGRSDKYIKNSDIKDTVDKATEQLVDAMMSDTINTNDPVWIFNSENSLNVVGSINYDKRRDTITFKLITVMFHDNFYNKMNSYKITV
jgi:hypothetical protein